jgi:hypothetical protein
VAADLIPLHALREDITLLLEPFIDRFAFLLLYLEEGDLLLQVLVLLLTL